MRQRASGGPSQLQSPRLVSAVTPANQGSPSVPRASKDCNVRAARALVGTSHVGSHFVRGHCRCLAFQLCCGPARIALEHCAGTAKVQGCPHIILRGTRDWLLGNIEISPSRLQDHQWETGLELQLQMVFPRVVAHWCRGAGVVTLELEEREPRGLSWSRALMMDR
jgi:hypothetical protein